MPAGDYPEPPTEGQTGALLNWKSLNQMYDAWQNGDFTGGGGGGGTEFLDATAAPYSMTAGTNYQGGTDATNRNGSASTSGMQKAVLDSINTGKKLWLGVGVFDMRLTTAGNPNVKIWYDMTVKKRRVQLAGVGAGATVLDFSKATLGIAVNPNDTFLVGDPGGRVANFAIDMWMTNNTNSAPHIMDLTIQGPGSYGAPSDPENRADGFGLHMGGRILVERVEINGFHSAAVYRMRGADHNIDHNTMRDCNLHNNFYNVYWCYYNSMSGSNSGDGDHVIENTTMSQASKASRAVDPAGRVFDSKFVSNHGGFSAYGWYSEMGPQGDQALPGTATVSAVASTKLVTLDTHQAAISPAPWGPFDNSYANTGKKWNWGDIPPAFGFIEGDCIDLDSVKVGGNKVYTGNNGAGMVTAVGGTGNRVLTILMEGTVVDVPANSAVDAGGTIKHHYNNVNMLDTNIEADGTYEGCGNANIFCPNRTVVGYAGSSTLPFHSLMSVDNNKGFDNAYSPIPILQLVRKNLTHPGGVGGNPAVSANNDIMEVTGTVSSTIPILQRDSWFFNTPHGAGLDDNAPANPWQPKVNRFRGVHTILTWKDNLDGTATFTYRQTANNTTYDERTIGNGSATSWDATNYPTDGSAGGMGRVAGFVANSWTDNQFPTFDISPHPPDNNNGGKIAALEMVCATLYHNAFVMLQGLPIYIRAMAGTTPATAGTAEPPRSICLNGDRVWELVPTAAVCPAGYIMERTGNAGARPYQGNKITGVAFWDRPNNDYTAVQTKGILRNEGLPMPYCAKGVLSLASIAADSTVVADNTFHGFARTPGGTTCPIVGRAITVSTQDFTALTGCTTQTTPASTVTKNAHGLVNGQIVFLTNLVSTTGVSNNTPYYVVNAAVNTFQLANSFGGVRLVLTTNGTVDVNSIYTTPIDIEPQPYLFV